MIFLNEITHYEFLKHKMAYRQRDQYGIKDVSVSAYVPKNDVARLMYYLNCACAVVEYNDNNINRYCDYDNWSQLSNEDIHSLVVLCYTLSPDLFHNKAFFHFDSLCGNDPNKFFEINQVNHQLLAIQSIVIADQTCRVNRIMTYKMRWMNTYYFNPMKNLARRLNNQNQRLRSSTYVIS